MKIKINTAKLITEKHNSTLVHKTKNKAQQKRYQMKA